jgi:hypothetical protein
MNIGVNPIGRETLFPNPSTNFVGLMRGVTMNKRNLTLASILLGAFLSVSSIAKYENTGKTNINPEQSTKTLASTNISTYSDKIKATDEVQVQQTFEDITKKETKVAAVVDTAKTASGNINNKPLSRGGTPSQEKLDEVKKKAQTAAKAESEKESKVELLDWWESGRYVFPKGSTAEVTDVYTGKSFKVMRTMGTNHADAEALAKEDTAIIKSIWGGFSWDRRPVIVKIDGRRLAASMSAMPHAGLDSKPAYAYVKNRSDGYGSGDNLDLIKGNNMDGHFDIHFLNSTRHMDGKKDPEHQAAIKIAAGK